MKVIVAGSRTCQDREKIYQVLDYLHGLKSFSMVISGLANGPDLIGKEWAEERGIEVMGCHADWKKYGKIAGIIRNTEMANVEGSVLVAFYDGSSKGTADMIRKMKGRILYIVDVSSPDGLDF